MGTNLRLPGNTRKVGPWPTKAQAEKAIKNVKADIKRVQPEGGVWYAFITNYGRQLNPEQDFKGNARAIYLRKIDRVTKAKELPENGLWFPVAPNEFTVSGEGMWDRKQLIGAGIASHPIGPPLRQVSFRSFFPSSLHRSVAEVARVCQGLRRRADFTEPREACTLLEALRDTNDIFWLVIGTDILSDGFTLLGESTEVDNAVKMPVYITNFSWSEAAGRLSDRLFDITFTEYKPQSYRYRSGEVLLQPLPKVHKPTASEDLVDIAIRYYGVASKWQDIAKLNGLKTKKIPKDPRTKKPKVIKLVATTKKPKPASRTPRSSRAR